MLAAVGQQRSSLARDLTTPERQQLDTRYAHIQAQHNQLQQTAADKHKQLAKRMAEKESFQQDLDKLRCWLEDKEAAVAMPTQPKLKSADTHRDIQHAKVCYVAFH